MPKSLITKLEYYINNINIKYDDIVKLITEAAL